MSAESVSEATDEALERVALAVYPYPPDRLDRAWFKSQLSVAVREGRRALLDVLQPTPEELGGERRWVHPVTRAVHDRRLNCEWLGCVPVWRFPTSERDEQ